MTSGDHELAKYDLGICSSIQAEAVGPPGERHFRLRVQADRGVALLWLEKEQLYELALAIKRMLDLEVQESVVMEPGIPENFTVDYDFQIARLAIGRDQDSGLYVLFADQLNNDLDVEDDLADENLEWSADELGSDVAFRVRDEQLGQLAEQAVAVCASGRPRCPLCGAPIDDDEPHICSRSNGHRKVES